jgi:hypothetical protein
MTTEIQSEETLVADAAKEFVSGVDTFMRITGMYNHPAVALQNQYKQLEEEVEELYRAYTSDDVVEILDGMGDCVFVDITTDLLRTHLEDQPPPSKALFTLRGLMYTIQPTDTLINACLGAVVVSNLSKFDQTEGEVSLTAAHYNALGINVESLFDEQSNMWFVKVTEDCTDTKGKTYHKG